MLLRQMAVAARRNSAATALFEIGSDSALEALLGYVQSQYQHGVATALLHDARTAEEASLLVGQHLQEANKNARIELLQFVLDCDQNHRALDQVFADKDLQDHLRETAFDNGAAVATGQRMTAIRALIRFDPTAAFVAAHAALRDDTEGREAYVYLLMGIDPDRAITVLFDHALTEKNTSMLWAIGRSLAHVDYRPRISTDLAAPDARRRATACRIASRLPWSDWLDTKLRVCLDDPDIQVSTAARDSLCTLHAARVALDLSRMTVACEDRSHRWALLDGLLSIADPGDADQPWPRWAREVAEGLPRDMRAYLATELMSRQREVLRKAETMDD